MLKYEHSKLLDLDSIEFRNQTPLRCQLCGSSDSLVEILNLGDQPICNALLSSETLDRAENRYPLKLFACKSCYLVQLANIIQANTVFSTDYNYLSGTTQALIRHFQSLSERIIERFDVKSNENVCDIGSNDGTFLRFFKDRGINVMGVEPTPLPAKTAIENDIPTITEFFTKETGDRLIKDLGKIKVVTAMNVLAHTDKIHSFLEGVKRLMSNESVFISQSHYLPALIDQLEYDTIYHEHLRYYTLTTLEKLLQMHGFHIFEAEINEIYGGSILVYCSTKDITPSARMRKILHSETKYQKLETYTEFTKSVKKSSNNLIRMLSELKEKGKRIVGIGAPMKSSTLLNYCNIGTDILDYLAEVNPLKVGKYLPGVQIPIVDESVLFSSQPDYALILSWNVATDIITSLRKRGYAGKFIIPIPELRIID